MPNVKVGEHEAIDTALRRFKRSCERASVLSEIRRREYYEKPTTTRRRTAAIAARRQHKRLLREQRRFKRLY